MDKITNALLLREESEKVHVAVVYGVIGLVTALVVFGGSNE